MQEIITISNSWPAFGNSSQLPPYNHILNVWLEKDILYILPRERFDAAVPISLL
jgi:hypothetical protein